MAMSVAVEAVGKGDRVVLWIGGAPEHGGGPRAVVIGAVHEDAAYRTFQVSHEGASLDVKVPRGQTVDLVC